MYGTGQPGPIGRHYPLCQFIRRNQHHTAFRVQIGLDHPGRSRAHAAVSKKFDVSDAQAIVAVTAGHPQRDGLVQVFSRNHRPDAQIELIATAQRLWGRTKIIICKQT